MEIITPRIRLLAFGGLFIAFAANAAPPPSVVPPPAAETPPPSYVPPPVVEPVSPPTTEPPPPSVAPPPAAETPPFHEYPVVENSVPTISGNPPTEVVYETLYQFQPAAEDGDGDILHFRVSNAPPWAGFDPTTGTLAGTPGAEHIGNVYEDIVISVTDGADDAFLEAYSISVRAIGDGTVALSWIAPTENMDGSPLTDLAGYKLYWGTVSGEYSDSVTLASGIQDYVIDGLAAGTYYFVATAFNAAGGESEPSEELSADVS